MHYIKVVLLQTALRHGECVGQSLPPLGISVPSRTGPTVLSCFVQKINPKLTDFQPSYRIADGWFCENQPRSNLCIS